MPTFRMHTKFSVDPIRSTEAQRELEKRTMDHLRSEFTQVTWKHLSLLGPYEYIETFCAPNMDTAVEITEVVRSFGNAQTEGWPAS